MHLTTKQRLSLKTHLELLVAKYRHKHHKLRIRLHRQSRPLLDSDLHLKLDLNLNPKLLRELLAKF